MEALYVIKRPLLTEKNTFAMNEQARYAFLVDRRASKTHALVTLWRGPAPPDERELDHLLDRLDL